jgi:hypothetical protein
MVAKRRKRPAPAGPFGSGILSSSPEHLPPRAVLAAKRPGRVGDGQRRRGHRVLRTSPASRLRPAASPPAPPIAARPFCPRHVASARAQSARRRLSNLERHDHGRCVRLSAASASHSADVDARPANNATGATKTANSEAATRALERIAMPYTSIPGGPSSMPVMSCFLGVARSIGTLSRICPPPRSGRGFGRGVRLVPRGPLTRRSLRLVGLYPPSRWEGGGGEGEGEESVSLDWDAVNRYLDVSAAVRTDS